MSSTSKTLNLSMIGLLSLTFVTTCVLLVQTGMIADLKFHLLSRAAFVIGFGLVFVEACRLILRRSYFQSIAIGFMLILLVSAEFTALASTALFSVSSVSLGRFIATRLGINPATLRLSSFFLLGAGCIGSAVGFLVAYPINSQALYICLLFLPLFTQLRNLRRALSSFRLGFGFSKQKFDPLMALIASLLLAISIVIALPEVGYDALATHLFIPNHVFHRGYWGYDPTIYVWATLPMLADWIYTTCFFVGGEVGARAINLMFLVALCDQTSRLVTKITDDVTASKIATLLVLSLPLTYIEVSTLFTEIIWASFLICTVLQTMQVCTKKELATVDITLPTTMFSFAAATKPVTLALLPAFLLLWLFFNKKHCLKIGVRALIIALAIAVILGMAPYIRAFIITGNPVFPFFNGIFESSFYYPTNFDNPIYDDGISLFTLFDATFNSSKYIEGRDGTLGFHFFLLLPASFVLLLWARNKAAVAILAALILAICLVFSFQSYLRYIYPMLTGLCAVVAIGWHVSSSATKQLSIFYKGLAVFGVVLNLLFWSSSGHYHSHIAYEILLNKSQRQAYISRTLPTHDAINIINEINQNQEPVAFFTVPFAAGMRSDVIHGNWYNSFFDAAFRNAKTSEETKEALDRFDVRFVLVNQGAVELEKLAMLEEISTKVGEVNSHIIYRLD